MLMSLVCCGLMGKMFSRRSFLVVWQAACLFFCRINFWREREKEKLVRERVLFRALTETCLVEVFFQLMGFVDNKNECCKGTKNIALVWYYFFLSFLVRSWNSPTFSLFCTASMRFSLPKWHVWIQCLWAVRIPRQLRRHPRWPQSPLWAKLPGWSTWVERLLTFSAPDLKTGQPATEAEEF